MDLILKQALLLLGAGFAVQWLRPGSKAPMEANWSQAPFPTEEEVIKSYSRGFNLGFRPGAYSVVDGHEICVLDIDVRGGGHYAEEAYAAANSIMEGAFEPTVVSGSGVGRHQYVQFPIGESPVKAATVLRESDIWTLDAQIVPPRTKGARPAWQVELLSTGKQVVMPPSTHPDTGNTYEWAGGDKPWA